MTTLQRLKKEALHACNRRGHTMSRFRGNTATCKICKRWVQVLDKTLPNQIDIGGPAVALDCEHQISKPGLAAFIGRVNLARTHPKLLRLVDAMSQLKYEGEPLDDGGRYDPTAEDAIATVNRLILEARLLLGKA